MVRKVDIGTSMINYRMKVVLTKKDQTHETHLSVRAEGTVQAFRKVTEHFELGALIGEGYVIESITITSAIQ